MTRLSVERLYSPKTLTRYWSRRMPSTRRRATCSSAWASRATGPHSSGMQNAECRMQNERQKRPGAAFFSSILHSAFFILHSASVLRVEFAGDLLEILLRIGVVEALDLPPGVLAQ